ncbi:hypothetical protein LOTGIDRAFT_172419 [Lottia gigantea]|uniref:alpha-1,6-mannosyl-glycoprotein 6-beta-N-acetylglucosaminyltransferase n=1 Tax=Lottia gigantea TaxID=225164 RepID=V4B6Q4_LOTGI|nr:hypothetical protein LOTGIDRAFT_172419 [Lottia gigantea]ESP01772.1 hypothetical protein LOTGIDRAFT_172419 [Lottia gigantea]
MAVLLESMLERLHKLENFFTFITNGTSLNSSQFASNKNLPPVSSVLQAKDIILGVKEDCVLTEEDMKLYPNCVGKMNWMKTMWKSDKCYASYGVDGSDCSFIMYLSEVEGFCPKKAWSGSKRIKLRDHDPINLAEIKTNLSDLMRLLVDPNERQGYAWIRMRISRMWDNWSVAAMNLNKNMAMANRPKKKILVHLGLLSKQSGWKFAENQFKGGPLGELVQWSDLISTLYLLGHDLQITSEVEQLVAILSNLPAAKSPCQSRKELPVDIIYTDIVGLTQFKKRVKGGYGKFICLFRILDSFGTEPAFNHRAFAKQNKILTSWGGQDLKPKQFFTMFPHSPDNSFMGFVVEQHLNSSMIKSLKRKKQAVVYGKNDYMWKGKRGYLDLIKEQFEIHGTVAGDNLKNVPSYVINHGILPGPELHKLLSQSQLFIGLGFPYEGPAPLEAIANGAVYINPQFIPPQNSKNTPFFKGKPTQRELASQHPYAEIFIGEPHVYTIPINKTQIVKSTLQTIIDNSRFKPYLPYEYTEEGMLQRMNAYIEHQNFCQFDSKISKWPPLEAMTNILGRAGMSCRDVCAINDLICESNHFRELNIKESLENNGIQCAGTNKSSNIYYPSYNINTEQCILQADELLFSCVGSHSLLRRLCPCRSYIKGQIALCIGCER